MKTTLSFFLICFLLSPAHGRYYIPKKEDAIEFLKRPVLVEIKEYDQEEVNKPGFDSEESYKNFLAEFNNSFKNALENYWKLTNTVEFKTKEEIKTLTAIDKSKYAVINSFFKTRVRETKSATVIYKTNFEVYEFVTYLDDREIFWIPMTTCFLSQGDFIFVTQQFNLYMEAGKKGLKQKDFFDVDVNLEKLKNNKVLYLPDYLVDPEMTKEKINDKYGYPNKIVPFDSVEKIIKNQNKKYAYATFIFCQVLANPSFVTVDAANGEILTLVTQGGINIGIAGAPPKQERRFETKAPRATIFKNVWGKNIDGTVLTGFRSKFAQAINKK